MYKLEILLITAFLAIIYSLTYFFFLRKRTFQNTNTYSPPYSYKPITPSYSKANKFKNLFFALNIISIIYIFGTLIYVFILAPKVTYTSITEGKAWNDYNKPFEVVFNKPVNKSNIKYSFTKPIKGQWKFEKANKYDFLKRKLVFYPEESLLPSNKILFTVTYKSQIFPKTYIFRDDFSSGVEKPNINLTNNVNDNQNVNPEENILFNIENADPNSYIFEFETTPSIKLSEIRDHNDWAKVTIAHTEPFKNGQQYDIKLFTIPVSYNLKTKEVINSGDRIEVAQIKFQIAQTPVIKEILPKGDGVLSNEEMSITFDHEMDRSSVENGIKIEPAVETTFEWNNEGNRVTLKHAKNFEKETEYKMLLSKNIKSRYGAKLEQEVLPSTSSLAAPPVSNESDPFMISLEHKFKTIGSVGVAETVPASGTYGVKVDSKISITFNQEVDKQSAESRISITPETKGKYNWDKNILTFVPQDKLIYAQRYTINIVSGIKSIDGLDLKSTYSFSFTTETKTVLLKAPIINQPAVFACNVTAAAIALQYKGVNVGPWDVYNGIPKSDTGDLNNGYWGNPNLGFVGNIRGGTTGYGVYWNPINNYISKYRPSEIKNGWNVTGMLNEVDKGNPVILWWQNGYTNPVKYSWQSKDANGNPVTINAVRGMHSEVVVGYIGSPENPSQIIISDPWASRWNNQYRYINVDQFKGLWSYFNNTAVVVR